MKQATLYAVSAVDHLLSPDEAADITLRSAASELMIDFLKERPRTIGKSVSAVEAQALIQKLHCQWLLVTEENGELAGLVDAARLTDEAIIRRIASGSLRSDITVAEMMIPRSALSALELNDVEKMRVDDVVSTMKRFCVHHCLVIDADRHHIRGMFLLDDIARRLHMNIYVEESPTFAELVSAIAH